MAVRLFRLSRQTPLRLGGHAAAYLGMVVLVAALLAAGLMRGWPDIDALLSPRAQRWLHIGVDGSIGLSYVAISATLVYLVYRARAAIPYQPVFLAFGAFILSCGLGHFAHIWTLFYPTSHLEGYIGIVTALASIATAIALPPLVPRVLHLIQTAEASELRKAIIKQQNEFFTTAAHELKTPLTGMVGYVDLLNRRIAKHGEVSVPVERALTMITDQTQRLHRLIDSLLDLSRMQQGKYLLERQPLDLQTLVSGVAERFAITLSTDHQLLVTSDDQPLWISGNDLAMERLLLNLLQNAVKYSPAGGPITITLSGAAEEACLQVADRGIGISTADQEHLCEQFFRGHNVDPQRMSGFGVGLYVVNEILQQHGGTLEVASVEGVGSTFAVRLPRLMPPQ